MIDEHVNKKTCLNTLAQSGTKALESLTHKNREIDLFYNTFTALYSSCVLPIIAYCTMCGRDTQNIFLQFKLHIIRQ